MIKSEISRGVNEMIHFFLKNTKLFSLSLFNLILFYLTEGLKKFRKQYTKWIKLLNNWFALR